MVVDITNEKYKIGSIKFDDPICEYAIEADKRSPYIRKIGECSVEVYDREGMIPHMHIVSDNKIICVCLHTNKYFSHDIKFSQFSNAKQREDLDSWLRKSNIKVARENALGHITNFEAAVYMWNKLNPHAILSIREQPDYSTMKDEIQNK